MDIVHIVKARSFISDGRVQKWVSSCLQIKSRVEVFFLEDDNIGGVSHIGGVDVFTQSLITRRYFRKRKGYFVKVIEYFYKTQQMLKSKDNSIVVYHDVQQYFNIFMAILFRNRSQNRFIVWDLHEIPHNFMFRFFFTKKFLKFLLEGCDLIIYTNSERKDFIHSKFVFSEKDSFVLNNYPSQNFKDMCKNKTLDLGLVDGERRPYILWLGAGSRSRNFHSFLNGYKSISDRFNLVVLGVVDLEFKAEVESYREKGMLYQKFVPQDEIIKFIDGAAFSVVLYTDKNANSLYCEPNRLFQLINRGVPVIVGNNPTLSKLVEKYKLGLILSDDGSNTYLMEDAMIKMANNYQSYDLGTFVNSTNLIWEDQFRSVLAIFNKIKDNENIINSSVF